MSHEHFNPETEDEYEFAPEYVQTVVDNFNSLIDGFAPTELLSNPDAVLSGKLHGNRVLHGLRSFDLANLKVTQHPNWALLLSKHGTPISVHKDCRIVLSTDKNNMENSQVAKVEFVLDEDTGQAYGYQEYIEPAFESLNWIALLESTNKGLKAYNHALLRRAKKSN